jgi:hypothetical protein
MASELNDSWGGKRAWDLQIEGRIVVGAALTEVENIDKD